MSVFVVVSIAIAVAIVAVTVVVGFRLAATVRGLVRSVETSVERIGPLTEELQDELAVTQTELDHLRERSEGTGGRG